MSNSDDFSAIIVQKPYLKWVLFSLLGILLISVIILSSVPPVSRDALTHHLAVPKLYLKHGGMYEIPSIKFSYYPMNLDLLYLVSLCYGNDIFPKFIHFAFALLTAWLIFNYLNRRIGLIYGLIGALFFLSLPVIIKLSITVYVDLGLVFFSTWSLIYLLKWLEHGFRFRYLAVSAVACGLALGTKYNGLIVIFLMALFVPYFYAKYQRGLLLQENRAVEDKPVEISSMKSPAMQALFYSACFILISLIVFSPWMIRNYIWTDNPVYPLYNGWFNASPTGAPVSGGGLGHFAFRRLIFNEPLWKILLIPVRIFFEGQDDLPRYFDGKLNPFLFILPVFAFLRFKRNPAIIKTEKTVWLSFVVLFLLFAFFKTDMRIRYVAPIIPPLVIMAIYGLHQIVTFAGSHSVVPAGKLAFVSIWCATVVMLGMNGAYIVGQFEKVDPLSYLSGRLDRDAYIQRYRPEYSALKYANRNLSNQSKILCIFIGNRRYYSDREMIFGDAYFRKLIGNVRVGENILTDLNEFGVTHMLIRYDMFNQWANQQLTDGAKKIVAEFFANHTRQIFNQAGYGLYQLDENVENIGRS